MKTDKQNRPSWYMALIALTLLLVVLLFWLHHLRAHTRNNTTNKALSAPEAKAIAKLIPNGECKPGVAVLVPYANERCVPWHVSAMEKPSSKNTYYLILSSKTIDPYALIAAGFVSACPSQTRTLVVENLHEGELKAAIDDRKPTALVVVGSLALARVMREGVRLPLLFALIPDPQHQGLDCITNAGISPWVPAKPMMHHVLKVLPHTKTNLALFFAEGPMHEFAMCAAKEIHKKALLLKIKSPRDLEQALVKAVEKANAWVVFPDQKIINHTAFARIQKEAEINKIPLAVPDEEHVRAGAYVGVGFDTYLVGKQLCLLAGCMERKTLPNNSHVFCPEYSFAVIHQSVVEKLGYILDIKQVTQSKLYKWH